MRPLTFFWLIALTTLPVFAGVAPASSAPIVGSNGETVNLAKRDLLFRDGTRVALEEGLLWVPENRHRADSRRIAVPFIRVPAANPVLSPRFYLPGGPGSAFVVSDGREPESVYAGFKVVGSPWGRRLIEMAEGRADLIFLNQRGNLLPMAGALAVNVAATPLATGGAAAVYAENYAAAIATGQRQLQARGYDLAGYDILHLAGDIEALRQALGYDRITLVGGSFGSQWSLAYLRLYPDSVDRALLNGVEPLDYAYDSPAAVDRAIARVLTAADASPRLAAEAPEEGYFQALKRVKARLAQQPVTVSLPINGDRVAVTLDGGDLATAVARLAMDPGAVTLRQRLALLPKFIYELNRGDYRFLALVAHRQRRGGVRALIPILIDNSLGISAARDATLKAEAERAFVGEVNINYRATRQVTVTPVVSDSFRAFTASDVPVMLVQGDSDFSTPLENSLALLPWLQRGRLMTVTGGTHQAELEVMVERPGDWAEVKNFLDSDRGNLAPGATTVSLPPVDFAPVTGPSLFELATE